MFSDEDIQDLYRLMPPGKADLYDSSNDSSDEHSDDLCSLLPGYKEVDLVTARDAMHRFEQLTHSSLDRVSVTSSLRELNLRHEADVVKLAKLSSAFVLLSAQNSNIITKSERDGLEQKLRTLVATQIVSKATFSQENDISIDSIDALTESIERGIQDDLLKVDGHLIGKDYHFSLMEIMKQRLNEARKEAIPVVFTSETVQGCPMWYVSSRLKWLLKVSYMESQFRAETSNDSIRCIPKSSVVQKRDAAIARLQSGDTPNIDMHTFSKDFGELYPTRTDAQDHLLTLPNISLVKPTAISKTWLFKFGEECVRFLGVNGYVDFTTNIRDCFPAECQKELYDTVEQQITSDYEQQAMGKLHRIGDFLSTDTTYNRERDVLLDMAKTHASKQWGSFKEFPDKDMKFHIAEVTSMISSDKSLLSVMIREKSVEKAVDEQYWSEISTLEAKNEAEFANFWNDRVVSRVRIYSEGLKFIEDAKLRDQLTDMLLTYLQKELLADSISKARSQGLVLSRKTRKNLSRFESTLKPSTTDISGAVTAVEKFSKKQGIPELDMDSLRKAKGVLIGDMARKMQKKQTDGPLLFLTLVIVLLAKQQEAAGVVYATGKFAPKLMKELKPWLTVERYEQLDMWKEGAKAGTLTADDKEEMKRLAGEA
ncbi:hypothetical protein K504DRAFT_491131 [Pleomassaria siparia CBS 279.74]|uniref:Uncharacterized protein n=1 Tax=Pleomassaria siparia CBS 279.74 TaxID=1314801 RepID=A0A6G1K9W6_9PLEO|nr:hypothetical protein K504DRAFT_491131 [Pleomassaria siparia CBS 279.74]